MKSLSVSTCLDTDTVEMNLGDTQELTVIGANKQLVLPRILGLSGRPGGGKDTHGDMLAPHYGYEMLRTSGALREYVAHNPDSDWSLAIQEAMNTGGLASDHITASVVTPALVTRMKVAKIIPIGFPRNLSQYELYRSILKNEGIDDDLTLHFDISEELATQRILAGNRGRNDDTPETVAKRMKVYQEQTAPMVDAMDRDGKLLRVSIKDLNEPKEQVQARAREVLESAFN